MLLRLLLAVTASAVAATTVPCSDTRTAYEEQCCDAAADASLVLDGACVRVPIGCATCARVGGTAHAFAQLETKPQLCVAFAEAQTVQTVMAVPRQMAFGDATTTGFRVDLYGADNTLVATRTPASVARLTTTLVDDPYGRAGTPAATNVSGAAGVHRVCYTVTSIADYIPPSDTAPVEWGTANAATVIAYQHYVKLGTWNVGLSKLGFVGADGALLPRATVDGATVTTTGEGGAGFSARDALRNAYDPQLYEAFPLTLTSWSWPGWQTLNKGQDNALLVCDTDVLPPPPPSPAHPPSPSPAQPPSARAAAAAPARTSAHSPTAALSPAAVYAVLWQEGWELTTCTRALRGKICMLCACALPPPSPSFFRCACRKWSLITPPPRAPSPTGRTGRMAGPA